MLKLVSDRPAPHDPDTVELVKAPPATCKHMVVQIDEELRTVTCDNCGERLDPIQVLKNIFAWVRATKAKYEYIQNWEKSAREKAKEKEANRRRKCRRCNKLFKEVPDEGSVGEFSHCGICLPCWSADPHHR
jgi:protein-arginine kinase activator protein McsA